MTKMFLREGKTVPQILKERGMVESTIWSHIEKLAADGDLTLEDLRHLEPASGWELALHELDAAMQKHGTERLKALYEETGEKFEYNLIRLARVEFLLENKENAF